MTGPGKILVQPREMHVYADIDRGELPRLCYSFSAEGADEHEAKQHLLKLLQAATLDVRQHLTAFEQLVRELERDISA